MAGSQGEPLSALATIARGEHKDVGVGPGDTVVLSARVIPGNERVVSRLISNLFRHGCQVLHPGVARVHVSGHAHRDDLAELVRLVRPRWFVPIHGEYRMLAQHAALAAQAGLGAEAVHLLEDGDVLELSRRTRPAACRRCPPRACCSTAPAWTGSRTWWCATGASCRATASWCPWWCSTSRPGGSSRRPRSSRAASWTPSGRPELLEEAGRVLLEAVHGRSAEERADPP